MKLSVQQNIEILMMVGHRDRSQTQMEVRDLFNDKYSERPITQSTVGKVEKKFRETGTVESTRKSGRPSVTFDRKLDVLLAVEEDPHTSVRKISRDLDVSKTMVHKLLKLEKWHPFKIKLVQELNDDDPDRRIEFCEAMMDNYHRDPFLVSNIIFSDEATFTLNGEVNRQNLPFDPQQALKKIGHLRKPTNDGENETEQIEIRWTSTIVDHLRELRAGPGELVERGKKVNVLAGKSISTTDLQKEKQDTVEAQSAQEVAEETFSVSDNDDFDNTDEVYHDGIENLQVGDFVIIKFILFGSR
ncbi:transposable element tc3 transposase-like protein [Holotrichia oblita]|uniref:Transposable element tc3 transposase-like protein n=1 Tax=Holotrichia oblita TaxID=644536 RepID=A0ACB9STC5_HOLOL|nr:transposable element tc3 transposase-like protein [Holotrichia oblita]